MFNNDDDAFEYRSAVPITIENDEASVLDERDESTLKAVRAQLSNAIDALGHDFNAFDVFSKENPKVAAEWLLTQIQGKQIAHAILLPLLQAIDSTIDQVQNKYRK